MVRYQAPTEWDQWVEWLAAGLHGRNRWRLSLLIMGMLFARGRRTVTSWLRAAGIADEYAGYYYLLQAVGRKAKHLSRRLLGLLLTKLVTGDRVLLAVDDSPTKRYGPFVEGAGIHHNPTPGPADQKFLYGHVWVTISLVLSHPWWGTVGLPLLGLLYVRARDVAAIPTQRRWRFHTKLELATAELLTFAALVGDAGKKLWVVGDGAYAKRSFLKPLREACVTVVSRLRKDAALFDLPQTTKQRRRGKPRIYGKNKLSLARRAAHRRGWRNIECRIYGQVVQKQIKTFLATYKPAAGVIRVVIVKEDHGPQFFFCTDPDASVPEIIEVFASRAVIEQDFHDVKEVWGAGQQQVRNIWTNIAVFNMNLWMHTLVECWAWHKPAEEIRNRSDSPWDDPQRRPSHADRRKALRCETLRNEYSSLSASHRQSSKIRAFYELLLQLAA